MNPIVTHGLKSQQTSSKNLSRHQQKVMIVEDDLSLCSLYEAKLVSAGYDVVLAHDGYAAITSLSAGNPPDLVLLDIVMPRVDGFGVLEAMAEQPQWEQIPVIVLTNLSDKKDIDHALKMGAKEFLIKSHFTFPEVLAKVEQYID